MIEFDFAILDFIQEYMTSPVMDKIMVFITTLGNGGAIWITTAILMLCSKKYRKTGFMLALGLIGSLVIGNLILKPSVARLRPFQLREGISLLIDAPHDYSFPSGHTLASFISCTILLIKEKKIGIISLMLAILIAFSRLYLYVHFPTDILGGIAFGIAIGFISVKTIQHIYLKKDIK